MSALAAAPAAPAEPAEARRPPEAHGRARDAVRLLVASRRGRGIRHHRFGELPELLAPGDAVVINTSRTLPAALPGGRADGGAVMVHLSTPVPSGEAGRWVIELRRDGARVADGRPGESIALPGGGRADLLASHLGTRLWVAELTLPAPLPGYLARHGAPIRYRHLDGAWPLSRHQTVFALEPGSAEMPSAGRPFTPGLVTRLVARGIDVVPIVLHTGVSSLERGEAPYPERFRLRAASAERVNLARRLGGRVIAVGTTVVRAIESAAAEDGTLRAAGGWTDLVLGPERPARAIDGILTGFHDRGSSHMDLLEAIADRHLLQRASRAATAAGYRRHEFGDVQLIAP